MYVPCACVCNSVCLYLFFVVVSLDRLSSHFGSIFNDFGALDFSRTGSVATETVGHTLTFSFDQKQILLLIEYKSVLPHFDF